MQSEAYHVGSYIREMVEDMVDLIVDHHAQGSFVKCHGEDLAVDDNALLLMLMMMNQLLTILMMNRMMVVSITSIQMVFVFNLKYLMMYAVILKHFRKMARQLVEIFPHILLISISYQTKWVIMTYRITTTKSCSVITPTILVIFVVIKWMPTSWPWWYYLAAHFYYACSLLMMVSMVLV